MIPLIDLFAQYNTIKTDVDNAISKCIAESNFIKGKAVAEFESAFSEYLGSGFCIGCANGTDALELILKALNIGAGDEVIVPALTWIATAEAVSNSGAEPVFADIDPVTYCIDYDDLEKKITRKTKAVIPVHLYGFPAEMDEIMKISKKHGLHVIEDCAQAHGAEYSGRKVGTMGIASSFSFFPSKNLGAFGDGGAVITDNSGLAEAVRKIANHGQLTERHRHFLIGRNSRLDAIQAAILSVKLKHLDDWNFIRQNIASQYNLRLKATPGLTLPYSDTKSKHVFHQFVIRCRNRNKAIELLENKQISWSIHYPAALPFTDAYKYKNHREMDYPESARITGEIISIPIYPELRSEQLALICDQLNRYVQ